MPIDLKPFITADFSADTFESFVHFFLITMVTSLGIDEAVKVLEGEKMSKAEVKLEINGVEFPFLVAMRRLYDQWGDLIKKEAMRMLKEEFSEKTTPIYDLLDDLKRKMEEQLGVEDGER